MFYFLLKRIQNYKSMCKTEEDAIQQDHKMSTKQPAGSWFKPLECFRGRSIRYRSNNKPRLPDGTKIKEIHCNQNWEKSQPIEFKNNCLFILWIDKYVVLTGCYGQREGGLAIEKWAALGAVLWPCRRARRRQGWHGPWGGKAGHPQCRSPRAAVASPAAPRQRPKEGATLLVLAPGVC